MSPGTPTTTLVEAQRDMRRTHRGGRPGQLVSAALALSAIVDWRFVVAEEKEGGS